MSGFEGPILKAMNPFGNNRPRLTASERIRNKRDATIYQSEKQRFQNKRTCGNKNVKYYDNGTIRSMKSYKLQKSLARGNVLCEDCDNKGTLCGPTERTNLNKIEMGNNTVSEFWGGGGLGLTGSPPKLAQTGAFPIIQVDISGIWGGSNTDISKSIIGPDASLNFIPIPYGYVSNLINIPRNLNGVDIVIDPSNNLFPDNFCEFAPYLKHSNLKTYIIVSAIIPLHKITMTSTVTPFGNVTAIALPGNCNDISYNLLINQQIFLGTVDAGFNKEGGFVNGQIKSVCCKRTINIIINTTPLISAAEQPLTGEFGLFDMNIEVYQIKDYNALSNIINYKPPFLGNAVGTTTGGWYWPFNLYPIAEIAPINGSTFGTVIWPWMIESVKMTQGTIEPSFNQTKYNATQQTYMSCLENGTRKINFTKNTVKQDNVISAYCKVDIGGNS